MSTVFNIHQRLRNSMEDLLANPNRNAALWNIFISYLVHISEEEFEDPKDRALFKRIKRALVKRDTEENQIARTYFRMRKEASAKISMDIFKLYESINQKYKALTRPSTQNKFNPKSERE